MRYQGSEAFDLSWQEEARREARGTDLRVYPGRGLDHAARQGVSREFLARAAMVAAAIVFLFVVGWIRVAVTTSAVSILKDNITLTTNIHDAKSLCDDLSAERSLLSSADRITRIATQNYGMVYAPGTSATSAFTYADTNDKAAKRAATGSAAALVDEGAGEDSTADDYSGDYAEGDYDYSADYADSYAAYSDSADYDSSYEGSGDAAQSSQADYE